jgi:hypothetical protein
MLAHYATAVIAEEWPAMTLGGQPRAAVPVLTELRLQLVDEDRANDASSHIVERALQQVDTLTAARAERILAIDEGLIGAIWWLIGVGGTITLLLCAIYAAEDLVMHRVLSGLISLVIMSVVLLIVATDRPFHGVPRVPPDAMREVLANELAGAK